MAATPRQMDAATTTRTWRGTRQEAFGSIGTVQKANKLVSSVAEGG